MKRDNRQLDPLDAARQIPEMALDCRWTYGNDRRNLW